MRVRHAVGASVSTTDYVGHMIYNNGQLDQVLTENGYIDLSGSFPSYHYYLSDHLGNNRVVLSESGTVEQVNHYYPFGGVMAESSGGEVQPWKFGGKELDTTKGLNGADFGSRYYYGLSGRWSCMDPQAEKYYSVSPYVYCNNNPVRLIDPDGEAWRLTYHEDWDDTKHPNGYEWVAEKDSYDENGKLLEGLTEQAIFFSDRGTFDSNKDNNIGSSIATVYKADGTTESYRATTLPSDQDQYATVPEGVYQATVGSHQGKYTALKMSDLDGSGRIELGRPHPNPAYQGRSYAEGINIHKAGKNNLTGFTRDKKPVSAGCLLIDRNKWGSFISNFDTSAQRSNSVSVTVSRTLSVPINATVLPRGKAWIDSLKKPF